MARTFITFLCESCGDCVPICPGECIRFRPASNDRRYAYIETARCTDCGGCAAVCPIEGAVVELPASDPDASLYRQFVSTTPK